MSEVSEVEAGHATADTAIVTTAETVAVSTGEVLVGPGAKRVVLLGWAQVTTGAGATSVTPRIRRGTAVTDTLVDEANAQAQAASTAAHLNIFAIDDDPGEGKFRYSLTVAQAGATGNGTISQAGILAIVL